MKWGKSGGARLVDWFGVATARTRGFVGIETGATRAAVDHGSGRAGVLVDDQVQDIENQVAVLLLIILQKLIGLDEGGRLNRGQFGADSTSLLVKGIQIGGFLAGFDGLFDRLPDLVEFILKRARGGLSLENNVLHLFSLVLIEPHILGQAVRQHLDSPPRIPKTVWTLRPGRRRRRVLGVHGASHESRQKNSKLCAFHNKISQATVNSTATALGISSSHRITKAKTSDASYVLHNHKRNPAA
jgi:hypothetical protein